MGGEKPKHNPAPRRHAGFLLREAHAFCVILVKDWHRAAREWEYVVHHTKQKVLLKFLIVLSIFLAYFVYVMQHFGSAQGALVAMLTLTFFVLCTPFADAGVIFDFPLHFFGVKMIKTEVIVWLLSANINIYMLLTNPAVYDETIILKLLQFIMTHPNPYWLILVLSAIGTFLSTVFADELVVVAGEHHRKIHQKHGRVWLLILSAGVVLLAIVLYRVLLEQLRVRIPLF